MIVDCHGHYTTAPKALQEFRDQQIAALNDPSLRSPDPESIRISDDEIRASLENAQLKLQRERGADLTIFSPRASAMAHHIGTEQTSIDWTRACNDLIARVCALYPRTSSASASSRNRRARRSTPASASWSAASTSSGSSAATSTPIRRAAIGRARR
jgi:hypothetical protein